MKNKILFLLMALFLGNCWAQKASAQTISAYFYNNISSYTCASQSSEGYITCTINSGDIIFGWSATPPRLDPYWTSPVPYAFWNLDTTQWSGPYNNLTTFLIPSNCSSENALGCLDIELNDAEEVKCGGYAPPYATNQTYTCSNYAQVINPFNAPIGSPTSGPFAASIFVSPDDMTLTKDPVNIATGEAYFSSTDFALNARGTKLALFRKYRSFSTFIGMFGYGWRTDFDANLSVDSSGDVTIYNGEGTGIYFMDNSGVYTPSPGNYSTLVKNANNTYTLTDKNGNVFQYGTTGRLTSRSDRNGNKETFVYNPALVGGTYIQDASGRRIILNIDAHGHVISAVDPAKKTFQYGYDANGNLVSITDPSGAVTNYYYDSNHKIIQLTNANGHNTYYLYDAQGRVTSNWQDNNVNKVSLNYQANNTTVVTDSLGKQNTYVFNNYGLETSHTDPLGAVTQETWDPFMNRTSLTDARNNLTTFGHDAEGNLTQIVDASNNQTSMTYTPNFNLLSSQTDNLGNVTNFVYDIKGNLSSIIDPLGNSHSFVYDKYGNVITAIDTRKHSTKYTYDLHSDLLQKTDAGGNKTIFTYDVDGNVLTQKDARNNTTSYKYDNLNRLLKTTFADATTVSYGYDLFGNQTSVTDQRGNTLTKTYDAYERLSQTKDPNGGITQYNYNTQGYLLTLTDANGNPTTYTYDGDGRVLTQANALNDTTSFTYDKVGNVASRTDANGKTTTYTYDALNRLTNTAYPDGTSVANVYDVLGHKISMTDATGQTSYTYDALSRLLSETNPAGSTITYTYDTEGNRISSVDQTNRTITNVYDPLNRLVSVTDPNGKTTYGYDGDSNKVLVMTPNGVAENYTYDALNRELTAVNAKGAVVISSYTNVYDVAGMIKQKTYANASQVSYSYDALNRLLTESEQTKGVSVYDNVYTYDPVGNRLTWTNDITLGIFWNTYSASMPAQVLTNMTNAGFGKTANGAQPLSLARSYNNDAANRLTSWIYAVNVGGESFPVQTDSYTYDQNGNRLTKQAVLKGQEGTPQQTSYAYDLENRLNGLNYVNIPGIVGAQTDSFTYNGDGLRTQMVTNNVTANYLYDGFNILLEEDGSGNTTKKYTRGLDLGGGIGSLIAQNTTVPKAVQYYDYDDLGSVANLTTTNGTTASSYSYDAYGNLLTPPAKNDTNRYFFSTKELDSREGLYYFGVRYYDPEIGRWLTQDPIGFVDGPNMYAFVENNPINEVDPMGLCTDNNDLCNNLNWPIYLNMVGQEMQSPLLHTTNMQDTLGIIGNISGSAANIGILPKSIGYSNENFWQGGRVLRYWKNQYGSGISSPAWSNVSLLGQILNIASAGLVGLSAGETIDAYAWGLQDYYNKYCKGQ